MVIIIINNIPDSARSRGETATDGLRHELGITSQRGGGTPDFDRPQRIHTQPGAPDFHKLRFPGLFPPFLTKEETKQLGSDDFSGPRTSRQWRFVPRRAILLAHHQAKSRLRISSTEQPPKGPRETKSPAQGEVYFGRVAHGWPHHGTSRPRPNAKVTPPE